MSPYSRAEARRLVVAKSAKLRFRLRRKLRTLPCSSSPHGTRFAGLPQGPQITLAIRERFDESNEGLKDGCAQAVLEQYGFKRVNFVLANSLKQMGCPHLIREKTRQWSLRTYVPPDGKYNRYFVADTAASLLEAFVSQANYDVFQIRMPKGRKDNVKDVAAATGESLNQYIISAINQRMERDSGRDTLTRPQEDPGNPQETGTVSLRPPPPIPSKPPRRPHKPQGRLCRCSWRGRWRHRPNGTK